MKLLISGLLFCLSAFYLCGAELFTIQNPGTNALTIVFIGDGWQASEKTNFLRFVTNSHATITNQAWVAGYPNRIKTIALFTNSNQSGITATSPNSDTPLGGYVSGQSVRQDPSKLVTIVNGSGVVSGTTYYPITVLNIGDEKATTLSFRLVITTNSNPNILAHELGHLIGNLDDEYSGGGASAFATNIAASASEGTNKWGRFIPPLGTPVQVDSIFVPSATCKLGSDISQQFCLVCSNEMSRVFFNAAGITNISTSSGTVINTGTIILGR